MQVIPHENFSHTVIISGVEILFRELTGGDIYFIELWRETDEDDSFVSDPTFLHAMIERLSVEPYNITEDEFTDFIHYEYNNLIAWFCENRLQSRLMTLNDWWTLCFHLGKQRWTKDMEWFETQPIVKIIQMSEIQTDFHAKINDSMKNNSKKK